MVKQSLAVTLVLLGLAFVGVVHTIVGFAYSTGLSGVGIVLVGVSLAGIVVVNR